MDWLLGDKPLVLLEGGALLALVVALMIGPSARGEADHRDDARARIFLTDAGTAALVWAIGAAVVLAGSIADIEGLRMPALSIVVLATGVCLAVVLVRRWRHLTPTRASAAAADPSRASRPRLTATTWEVGLLGAAAGAFGLYAITIGHATLAQPWGHPIHWIVAVVGGSVGYALGLGLATPRYTVRSTSH